MKKFLSITGNISAITGMLLFFYPLLSVESLTFTLWQKIFLSGSILICLSYIIYEICTLPKKFKKNEQINKYMKKWVNQSGRTVIFTRDMSWVDNTEIENELRNKARRNELIICLMKMTPLIQSLQSYGADVYTYDRLNYTPKSRFTFINYDSNSAKVAIGRKDVKHRHIITEYTTNDPIEYHLAQDLVNIIKKLP